MIVHGVVSGCGSCHVFFFQAEDGIRDAQEARGLGDVYKIQMPMTPNIIQTIKHTVKASVLTISTDQA